MCSFKSQLLTLSNGDFASLDELEVDAKLNAEFYPVAVEEFFAPFLSAKAEGAPEDLFEVDAQCGRALLVDHPQAVSHWLRVLVFFNIDDLLL